MTWLSLQFSAFAHNPWCSVQDTTPEGILSSCGCFLTLTLTTSIGIWHSAGATKSWLHSPGRSKSFAVIKNSFNSTEILCLDEKRNAQRWQSNTNWRRKKDMMMREKVWCHEILIPCYTTVLLSSIFFDFSSTAFEISLFLCSSVRRLTLFVLDSSLEIEEFLHKMETSFSGLKRYTQLSSFSCHWTHWSLSFHYSLWLLKLLHD